MGLLTNLFCRESEVVRKAGRAEGRVQKVGFGVTGWVKNMDDGSVAMELQGSPKIIEQVIDKIKTGRGRIQVTNLELADMPAVEGEDKFAIRK